MIPANREITGHISLKNISDSCLIEVDIFFFLILFQFLLFQLPSKSPLNAYSPKQFKPIINSSACMCHSRCGICSSRDESDLTITVLVILINKQGYLLSEQGEVLIKGHLIERVNCQFSAQTSTQALTENIKLTTCRKQ